MSHGGDVVSISSEIDWASATIADVARSFPLSRIHGLVRPPDVVELALVVHSGCQWIE
jgi:hypothetical protein